MNGKILKLIFGFATGISLSLVAQDRPNVLFIAIDDLKPLLNSYGQDFMHTPHIDMLAGNGVLFSNAHCQQAVCGPSRASLLTGMRPDYTGVWDLKTRMRDINPKILALPTLKVGSPPSTLSGMPKFPITLSAGISVEDLSL